MESWFAESLARLRLRSGVLTTHYPYGWWSCSYRLRPLTYRPSPNVLRQILYEVQGSESGWPVWLSDKASPMTLDGAQGTLECLLAEADDRDFWRASPHGKMFLLRRLQEDTGEIGDVWPGQFLDIVLPIWRTAECLLHASRLASRLSAQEVSVSMRWHGLRDRELQALVPTRPGTLISSGHLCDDDDVHSTLQAPACAIPRILPALVKQLTRPLYARFGFYATSDDLYRSEIARIPGAGISKTS